MVSILAGTSFAWFHLASGFTAAFGGLDVYGLTRQVPYLDQKTA
jgi:hypothetical protein